MRGYRKGVRKPRAVAARELEIGGYKMPPALLIAALLVALYALFLFGSGLQAGPDALVLAVCSLLAFAVFSYLARAGGPGGFRPFSGLIEAILALSALTFIQKAAVFLGLVPDLDGPATAIVFAAVFLIASMPLIALLLYRGKEAPADVFIRARRPSWGLAGLAIGLFAGVACLYLISGGPLSQAAYAAGMALAFGLLSAAFEEAWFRGVLLARLRPLAGDKNARILQALAFGVFEAFVVYGISPMLAYIPVAFIIASVLGYYLGCMAQKEESIVNAALAHAGLYALVGMLLFAGLL